MVLLFHRDPQVNEGRDRVLSSMETLHSFVVCQLSSEIERRTMERARHQLQEDSDVPHDKQFYTRQRTGDSKGIQLEAPDEEELCAASLQFEAELQAG